MGPLRTGSLESLRERNRLRVIDALRTRGAISRADIARQTGLSRSTVSSLVADLQAAGMVIERATDGVAATASQGGRPPVLVALDRSAGAVVGLDFGHDSLRVAVADLSYSILAESFAELEVDTAAEDALDTAATLVSELHRRGGRRARPRAGGGHGPPGPDRPRERPRALAADPARLGRARPRGGDGGAPRAARAPRQRRQRRRPRRVDLRRRPRHPRDGLPAPLGGYRRRPRASTGAPSAARAASRARSATSWSIRRARSAAAATAAASRPSSPAPRCASCCAARTAR